MAGSTDRAPAMVERVKPQSRRPWGRLRSLAPTAAAAHASQERAQRLRAMT